MILRRNYRSQKIAITNQSDCRLRVRAVFSPGSTVMSCLTVQQPEGKS